MQNYNLPDVNVDNTFEGVEFVLPADEKFNLTNAFVKLQVRKSPNAPVIKQFTSPSGLVISLPYTITLPQQLISVPEGSYQWDLKITFADGREKTYVGGNWRINPVITR